MATQVIEHEGVVDRVQDGGVYVKITSRAACGSCAARQACGLAEAQEKIVEVRTPLAGQYAPGEEVMVGINKRTGFYAILLVYVVSLIVLLSALAFTIKGLGWSEGVGVLVSLLSLGAYFVVLWLLRAKIEDKIKITITKI